MTKRCENELIIMVKEIVADLMESIKLKKKQKVRNNEYYNLQNIFDKLYEDSKNNKKFKNLYDIITCESNIMLAFRNIKKNKGSGTVGTDNINIEKYKDMNKDELVIAEALNGMVRIRACRATDLIEKMHLDKQACHK